MTRPQIRAGVNGRVLIQNIYSDTNTKTYSLGHLTLPKDLKLNAPATKLLLCAVANLPCVSNSPRPAELREIYPYVA